MKKIKETHIKIEEHYGDKCFSDSYNRKNSIKGRPAGFVEIHEIDEKGNKRLVSKSNLVVYLGRECVAQRIVDVDNGIPGKPTKDEFICWLGLGEGGVATGDPLTPLPPTNGNDDLAAEVPVSPNDSNCGDYRIAEDQYYKLPFTTVTFEQDTSNDDRYLITRIIITVGGQHANGYELSEAGLFTAESRMGGQTSTGPFHLFARVTFPTIIKTSDRQLVFTWYIYL